MQIKTTVGISNRHVHLTKETFKALFGDKRLENLRDLHQIGQFASKQTLTIKTEKNEISGVRIIGPFRNYNQVEISKSDARFLGLNPPVRESGVLENSETITLIGEVGEVTLNDSCIIAERHVHITKEIASKYGIKEGQSIKVKIDTIKKGEIEAFARISNDAYFELHLDTDDGNSFLLNNDDEVELEF